jgi:hypothetical protein
MALEKEPAYASLSHLFPTHRGKVQKHWAILDKKQRQERYSILGALHLMSKHRVFIS